MNRIRWSQDERDLALKEAKRILDETTRMPTLGQAQMVLPANRRRPCSTSNESVFQQEFRKRFGGAAAQGIVPEKPQQSDLDAMTEAAAEPDLEDRVIGFCVSVVEGILTHPAVVSSLHRLIRSAFEKEEKAAVDTMAAWPTQTVAAKLPRVLVVGIRSASQEMQRIEEQFGKDMAVRFWNADAQSKQLLKQLLHGSDQVVVIPARVDHSTMAMVKARSKKAPLYAKGIGAADVLRSLEYLAKQFIINSNGVSP